MKTARWRGCLPLFAVTLLLIYSAPAEAQKGPNLALNKPVIDESTQWFSGAATYHQYDGAHITDGLVCEMDQNEGGSYISSFWIGAEGLVSQTLVVDLQAPTLITEIHLRNTHNAQFNDRNTFNFQIDAANDIQVCGPVAMPSNWIPPPGTRNITTLVNPVTILVGQLSVVDSIICPDEIPPDIFDSNSGLATGGKAFRYLQFTAIDSYHTNKNVGLNELEVYGSQ